MNNFILFKQCSICVQEVPYFNFRKQAALPDGLCSQCRNCANIGVKRYYKENREKCIEAAKIWAKDNKSKTKLYVKKSKKLNGEPYRKYPKNRMVLSLSKNFKIKSRKTPGSFLQTLGCSKKDFINYIESKFESDMNWDNYGEIWCALRLKPLSAFALETKEDLLIANHYSNIVPKRIADHWEEQRKKP